MTTKARKLARKTRAAELDMEIMRAREANGLPVISPMLGLPRAGDQRVARADPRHRRSARKDFHDNSRRDHL
jgi:hypothetical protein